MTTRSFRGGQALRWHSGGDEFYEVTPGWRDEVGTTIELHVKPAASFLLRKNELIEAVRCYADFLPTPIYSKAIRPAINRQGPPWEDEAPDDCHPGIHRPGTCQGIEPLHVLRLHDGRCAWPMERLPSRCKDSCSFRPARLLPSTNTGI